MAGFSTHYLYQQSYPVENKEDFFKSGIKNAEKARKLDNIIRQTLQVSDKFLILNVINNGTGYRFDVLGSGSLKNEFTAQIYYIPDQGILDFYDHNTVGSGMPLCGFRDKKCVVKNYSVLLQTLKLENLFTPIVAAS